MMTIYIYIYILLSIQIILCRVDTKSLIMQDFTSNLFNLLLCFNLFTLCNQNLVDRYLP